jgi:hypothetical protein
MRRGRYRRSVRRPPKQPLPRPADYDALVAGLKYIVDLHRRRRGDATEEENDSAKNQTH